MNYELRMGWRERRHLPALPNKLGRVLQRERLTCIHYRKNFALLAKPLRPLRFALNYSIGYMFTQISDIKCVTREKDKRVYVIQAKCTPCRSFILFIINHLSKLSKKKHENAYPCEHLNSKLLNKYRDAENQPERKYVTITYHLSLPKKSGQVIPYHFFLKTYPLPLIPYP